MVVRGGSHFCQSPKSGGSFFSKHEGGPTLSFGKNTQILQPSPPPPPKKKRTFPYWSLFLTELGFDLSSSLPKSF